MFIFTDLIPQKAEGDIHVIVDGSIGNNAELINHIEKCTDSTYEDGDNWDGFNDSITDCSWLQHVNNVRIIHEGLPQIDEIHVYIDILNMADVYWEIFPEFINNQKEYFSDPLRKRKLVERYVPYDYRKVSEIPAEEFKVFAPNVNVKSFNVYFKNRDKEFVMNSLSTHSKDYRQRLYYDECGFIRIRY